MKQMEASMPAFDSQLFPPHPHMHTALPSTTFYADDQERAPYARGFDAQGKMVNGDGSGPLSTIGAERPAALGAKGDRHIFTMDEGGSFHTADAIKENKTRSAEALANGQSEMERFHHSSFHSGHDVAGAGELQIRDGQVEMVSDASGHYRPGSEQMMQTVQQLGRNNVSMERLGVEFIGKQRFQDGSGAWKTEKNLQASAMEMLGYENHASVKDTEKNMRAAHAKKDGVMQELLAKAASSPDGLKPSDIKPKPRPEEAASPVPSAPVASAAPSAQQPAPVEDHVYDSPDSEGYIAYNNIEEEAGENEAEQSPNNHTYDVVQENPYNNVYESPEQEAETEEPPSSPVYDLIEEHNYN